MFVFLIWGNATSKSSSSAVAIVVGEEVARAVGVAETRSPHSRRNWSASRRTSTGGAGAWVVCARPETYYYGLVLLYRNAMVALFPVLFVAVPEVQVADPNRREEETDSFQSCAHVFFGSRLFWWGPSSSLAVLFKCVFGHGAQSRRIATKPKGTLKEYSRNQSKLAWTEFDRTSLLCMNMIRERE